MKTLVVTIFLLCCGFLAAAQTSHDSTVWFTDIAKAQAISQSTGKPIFAFFTGSDWCGWCKKLQAEVFAKPAFIEWADQEVVLLELDFPMRKALPEPLVQQNQSLKSFFNITGFPTIWLFCINEDKQKEKHYMISPHGSLGYPRNPIKGQEEVKFLEEANAILGSKTCQ